MSDLRIFSIFCLASMIIAGTAENLGWLIFEHDKAATLVGIGLLFGCGNVILFGRKQSDPSS